MPDIPLVSPELLAIPAVKRRMDQLQARDRRWGAPGPDCGLAGGIAEAACQANALADRGADPVSATLYAFGSRPHLFSGAWRTMTYLLVAARAHDLGLELQLDDHDFEELLEALATQPSIVRVCRWVEPRLSPPSRSEATPGRVLRLETSGRACSGSHRAPAPALWH